MDKVYDRWGVSVYHGDNLDVLRTMESRSVHALVTDPPAGIAFMSKEWDSDMGGRHSWVGWLSERMREAHRVLKPGGYGLVWAIPRTSHWTAWALEDAGFEIRDCIVHLFGAGFPKSLDVSKQLDKAAGVEREVVGSRLGRPGVSASGANQGSGFSRVHEGREDRPNPALDITAPATDAARQWAGFGTSLKPAAEHWWLIRKPMAGTVAQNVQEHGVGAINIDACRVAAPSTKTGGGWAAHKVERTDGWDRPYVDGALSTTPSGQGRWPTNVVLTHGDCDDRCDESCPVAELDAQSGTLTSGANPTRRGSDKFREAYGEFEGQAECVAHRGQDSGGASRFFATFRHSASDQALFPIESDTWEPPGERSTKDANTSAGRNPASTSKNSPTGGFGSKSTATSPRDTKSTTGTTTHSTTTSATSCASPPSGTTTTTSDFVNNTAGSTGWSKGSASAAASGNPSPSTTSGEPEPGRATADHVNAHTDENGSEAEETSSTPEDASGTPRAYPADGFPAFIWAAKAPTAERPKVDGKAHPTVKSVALMRWMVRLVTPPGGTVLDLFAGTGTTGHAARAEGMRAVLIEQDADHIPLIVSRLDGYRAPAPRDEDTGQAEPMDLLDLLGGEAS